MHMMYMRKTLRQGLHAQFEQSDCTLNLTSASCKAISILKATIMISRSLSPCKIFIRWLSSQICKGFALPSIQFCRVALPRHAVCLPEAIHGVAAIAQAKSGSEDSWRIDILKDHVHFERSCTYAWWIVTSPLQNKATQLCCCWEGYGTNFGKICWRIVVVVLSHPIHTQPSEYQVIYTGCVKLIQHGHAILIDWFIYLLIDWWIQSLFGT